MRVSRQEKDLSQERIVRSAAKLLRERGIEGASVSEVMKDAGLTHGGFYRHFANKDAMVEGALEAAFDDILKLLATDEAGQSASLRDEFRDFYLSDMHLHNAGQGCPAVALAGDVAKAPPSTKKSFSTGLRRMLSALSQTKKGTAAARHAAAARELSMMVGAMVLARACDPFTANHILTACRST